MNEKLKTVTLETELCVIGGGLSGCFGALAAARRGVKVVLMQDRSVLGGNASEEVRMWVRGARGYCNRESGLLMEWEERNIHNNPTLMHSQLSANLYAMLRENENITLLMNTSCLDAKTEEGRITQVTGWQLTTYRYITVRAKLFCDCSGDSILAPLVGAEYRMGREAKEEFSETLAQEKADGCTMGMSIILAARETDHPVKFTPPPFANVYESDECFASGDLQDVHVQIRDHKIGTSECNLWWVELGGEGHSLYDADRVRDELLAAIYGVWDHIKNRGDHGMENWELEWVGTLPGKRESRRYVGDVTVTEADVVSGGHFPDEIAYGGWPLDDHNPYGMRPNPYSNEASRMISVKEPYGLPLRALYSKDVPNLMFAGRNISVSHVALSSTRVMGTCALLGQAMGTAAAFSLRHGLTPRQTAKAHYGEIQRQLMEDGVFLPHHKREYHESLKRATMNLSPEEREILLNGVERPRVKGDENGIWQNVGDSLCITFDAPQRVEYLRLQLDPDFSRKTVSENMKMRIFAMKLHTGKDFVPVSVAASIVKDLSVYADGKELCRVENNFLSLLKLSLHTTAKEIRIQWNATNGSKRVHLFGVDLIGE